MKLEYLSNNTAGGKYPGAWPQRLIRLYDFDELQNQQLLTLLGQWLPSGREELDLGAVGFVESVNCRLTLRLSATEHGIRPVSEANTFTCELTAAGFEHATQLMRAVSDGYAWLDEVSDSPIEFLYSPGGTW